MTVTRISFDNTRSFGELLGDQLEGECFTTLMAVFLHRLHDLRVRMPISSHKYLWVLRRSKYAIVSGRGNFPSHRDFPLCPDDSVHFHFCQPLLYVDEAPSTFPLQL